ncbi:MAG: substrate-binding domain-containing protein [Firmicutes bacterium]|nr:substrate-binding domain-containing protein [Bacillota bacterium]MBQ3199314.1 substrate-binding domain-containing protein [Bacillota bacterium]
MKNLRNSLCRLSSLLLVAAAALGLMAGCTGDDPVKQADPPLLTPEEYPVVDGSTANLPMMVQIMQETTGITQAEAEQYTTCNKTSGAWYQLAYGYSDLLLVYEAAEVVKDELANIGTELDITPIGRDALVFIVNEDNPVQNLTRQQLIDIYTGQITNWQQVGGADLPIVAFQRPDASGSQSLFMKLLMTDDEPMAAPTELRPAEMGELIEDLATYDNTDNALGFSVFYYANYMYSQPGLRFVAVDGVLPSDETIADGTYPLLNEYYLAVRADEPADSPTMRLHDWILSDKGEAAIRAAGYIPLDLGEPNAE